MTSRRLLILSLCLAARGETAAPPAREDAHRANNLGVALLEQVKFAEAAEAFRRALKLDPGLAAAQVNLAISLYNVPDLPGAEREARRAVEGSKHLPQAHYVAGLVAKAQNRPEDALASFRRVLEIDPDDVGARVNLAQVLMQQRQHAEAIALLRRAIEIEPHNSTSAYVLGTALRQSGQIEAAQEQLARFQKLREAGYGTSLGQTYPTQGRHAEAVVSTGLEPALVDAQTPAVVFEEAGPPRPAVKGHPAGSCSTALVDFDGDGDGDVAAVIAGATRLLRNDKGTLVDATASSGDLRLVKGAVGVVGGDYDNDGQADLLVLREAGLRLLRGDGSGGFRDVSAASGVGASTTAARAAAFVDTDHDGDLDIVAAGAGVSLLQNDGQGRLKDVAAAALVKDASGVVALVPTDFDNRRDVDLLLAVAAGAPRLFKNQRVGTFRDVAAEVGLEMPAGVTAAAAGDVNKDGYTDFFFGRAGGAGTLALSDGRERFTTAAAPEATAGARAALLLDYDNDGLLDLVLATARGLRVVRHLGDRWADVSAAALRPELLSPRTEAEAPQALAAGDLDGDGDLDLVIAAPAGVRLARNEGAERRASLLVRLAGKTSNRSGVGAKVEARAGSLRHRLESYAASPAPAPADLLFGLGTRTAVDAIRILWPSGTLQAETELPAVAVDPKSPRRAALTVEELDRTPSSCPYLFAWNGERFAFVTDFMGGGEMGAWLAPGVRNRPDPEEYVRIAPDRLRARDGAYELRVTHELEEVLYVDRLELLAVDHPEDAAVFPNEGLTDPPRPFRLHVPRALRPVASAEDEHGHDVAGRLHDLDGRAVDDFEVHRLRGYAAPHALTLDLGETGRPARLLLTGWTEYSFSSDNVAAHQAGLALQPPALQVRGPDGGWTTAVADIGFPVGRPQTIVVDLAGLPPGTREVRITTNMRVFWDQARVDAGGGDAPAVIHRLAARSAELRARGFSSATAHAGGTPLDFDYARVSTRSPWKAMPGRYTRPGDVRPLLAESDDLLVVAHPGDEIALAFPANVLAPPPKGWIRTFLLHADGFSKEMNLHSASPDVVGPLPYHGMPEYPYDPEAAPARREYVEAYLTREVVRPLPRLEVAARP